MDGGGQLGQILIPWRWAGAGDLSGCDGGDAVACTVIPLAGLDTEVRDECGDGTGVGSSLTRSLRKGGDGEGQDGGNDSSGELHIGSTVVA